MHYKILSPSIEELASFKYLIDALDTIGSWIAKTHGSYFLQYENFLARFEYTGDKFAYRLMGEYLLKERIPFYYLHHV